MAKLHNRMTDQDKTDIINALIIKYEVLKMAGLIEDYSLNDSIENLSVGQDGILEHDVHIDVKIVPKQTAKQIEYDLVITPPQE